MRFRVGSALGLLPLGALGALPLPSGERERVRGLGSIERPKPLTPPLSPPKSDISDFGQFKVPNSGKPEFGWEREPTESVARPAANSPSLPSRRRSGVCLALVVVLTFFLPLSARPLLAGRPEGQEQRRPADRGAGRAAGAHRGRLRARSHAHRRGLAADHRERDHPAL